jgi:hypothetical protein
MAMGNGLSSAHNYYVHVDPPFTPSSISNLALWLKYNTGYTSVDDETTAAGDIDDNDRIKQWDDQSGNNNHATQSTNADMPRFESDDNSMKFANRSKYMNLTSTITIGDSEDFTAIIRLSVEDFDNYMGLLGHGGNDFLRLLVGGTGFRAKLGDTVQNNWIEASDTISVDTYYIITFTRSNGGTGDLTVHIHGGSYDDKEWDAAENATDTDSFTISNVGCETDDAANLKGYMKDFLIYNGTALSSGQRNEMYTYLNSQT